MSTEHHRILLGATLAAVLGSLVACSEDQGTEEVDAGPVDVTPRSVGVDRFGCPMVDPTPWGLDFEDYQTFCGDGCFPLEADLADAPKPERWFVACISDEIERAGVGDNAPVCSKGPVDGRGYFVYNSTLLRLMELCWYFCTDEGPNPDPAYGFPDHCFE